MYTTFDLSLALPRFSSAGFFLAFLLTGSNKLQYHLPEGSWSGDLYARDGSHHFSIRATTLEEMEDFAKAIRKKYANHHRPYLAAAFADEVLKAATLQAPSAITTGVTARSTEPAGLAA